MGLLVTFLFRNMKGLRSLVLLAMIITVLQVSCDIIAAFPLKFIPSKVQNVGNDPKCLFPFLDPIESWFDIPQLDPSLQPDPNLPPNPPPEAQCPVNPNDVHAQIVLVSHSTIGVSVFSVMFFLSPQYTLIALAIAPALFMIVLGYTKNIKAAAKKAAKATGQVADVATEDINALTVIKVFTREEREAMRFGSYVDKNKRAGLRAGWLQAQFTPLVTLLVILGTAAVIGIGGYVANGSAFSIGPFTIAAESVDIGTLILFLTFLKLLYQPMRDLSKLATLASTAGSGTERIQEVLDQAPEVKDSPIPGPYTGPQRFRGGITFENVWMSYVAGQPVLKGINLHLSPGRRIALVGLSGGGKTTLAKLISRFYDIHQGVIKIDGVDTRLYPLDVLRNNVSMVLQDSILFEGTIRENIAIGRPGASIEQIVEVAKKANIHETIMNFPEGYDTTVREQGKNFSGCQRQRIAIARALLRDAPILILDEPTAALDVESEAEVMHALDQLVVNRTVIVISHRLSTLGNVDEILVLKQGLIAERGSYKHLKQLRGIFANLLAEQNRYSAEGAGDKSILRSAFQEASAPQKWGQPAALAVSAG